jgi:hypothetical protein
MVRNLRLSKIFWNVTAAFALLAALPGILFKDVYAGVFAEEYLPGAYPQDVLTILVALSLFVLIATTKEGSVKKQIIIIGLIGSLFYLYGIFTIERVFTWYYLLYAAVFASSFWSLVYSLSGFRSGAFSGLKISRGVLTASAIASIAIAVLFTFLWTMALIPLMREHNRIEFMYSIYILDLCFIMPAFVILAVMSLRRLPFGILVTPALMILGFFVIFPLGLNELAKPSAGLAINFGSLAMSFLFAFFMLALAWLQLKMIRLS